MFKFFYFFQNIRTFLPIIAKFYEVDESRRIQKGNIPPQAIFQIHDIIWY